MTMRVRGLDDAYSSAGIRHVVHQDGHLVLDVTDKNHSAHDIRPGTLLVNQSKSGVETVSQRGGTLRTAGIRGYNDAVLDV